MSRVIIALYCKFLCGRDPGDRRKPPTKVFEESGLASVLTSHGRAVGEHLPSSSVPVPTKETRFGSKSGSAHKGNEHRTTTSASANLRSEHRTKGNEQTRGNGRDVDGFCLATTISMGYTSPGCRRAMPRHFHFDGLHLTGRSAGICLAASGFVCSPCLVLSRGLKKVYLRGKESEFCTHKIP